MHSCHHNRWDNKSVLSLTNLQAPFRFSKLGRAPPFLTNINCLPDNVLFSPLGSGFWGRPFYPFSTDFLGPGVGKRVLRVFDRRLTTGSVKNGFEPLPPTSLPPPSPNHVPPRVSHRLARPSSIPLFPPSPSPFSFFELFLRPGVSAPTSVHCLKGAATG